MFTKYHTACQLKKLQICDLGGQQKLQQQYSNAALSEANALLADYMGSGLIELDLQSNHFYLGKSIKVIVLIFDSRENISQMNMYEHLQDKVISK